MTKWSGANMRCPTCNKYMPDRCTCAKPITENNVAAQAGDEPMRAAFEEWMAEKWFRDFRLNANGDYIDERIMWAWEGFSVSPRATADVEREVILEEAARLCDAVSSDWAERSEYEKVFASEYLAERIRALKSVATTKPGA